MNLNQARSGVILKQCLKSSVFWIYSALMLFYSVIMVAIMASAQTEQENLVQSEAFQYANETLYLWKQHYILQIVSTNNDACPENYEDVFQYKWPGTMQGCACPYETELGTQVFIVKGKCNSELISYSCYDVAPTSPEFLHVWKGGRRVCMYRDPNHSFFTSPDSKCLDANVETHKKCGSGSRAVCRSASDDCPVTYLSMQTSILTGGVSANQNFQEYINVSSSLYYTFERETVGFFPAATFRLDEYAHCAHLDLQNISPDKKGDYILLKRRRQECPTRDARAKFVDSVGEEDLFTLNEQLYAKIRALPAYPRPSNDYTWVFSFQEYPQWAFECRANAHYKMSVAEERLSLRDEQNNETHIIVTTIVSSCFIGIVLLFIEVRRRFTRNKEIQQFEKFTSEEKHLKQIYDVLVPRRRGWVRETILLIVLDRAAKLINIPSIFIVYWEVQTGLTWFRQVRQIGCGDAFFNENIADDYIWYLNQLYQYYGAMLGLWWFVFTIDWAYLVFRYFTEIQHAIQEEKMPLNYYGKQQQALLKKIAGTGELDSKNMNNNIQDENEFLYKKAGGNQPITKLIAVHVEGEDDDQQQQIDFSKQVRVIDEFEMTDQINPNQNNNNSNNLIKIPNSNNNNNNLLNSNNKQLTSSNNVSGNNNNNNNNQRDTSMQGLVPNNNNTNDKNIAFLQ